MPNSYHIYPTLYLIPLSPEGHWHFQLQHHCGDSQSHPASLPFHVFLERNPDLDWDTMKRLAAGRRWGNQELIEVKNLICQENPKTRLQELAWQSQ